MTDRGAPYAEGYTWRTPDTPLAEMHLGEMCILTKLKDRDIPPGEQWVRIVTPEGERHEEIQFATTLCYEEGDIRRACDHMQLGDEETFQEFMSHVRA